MRIGTTPWIVVGLLAISACGRAEAGDIRDEIEEDDYRNTYARAPGWESGRLPSDGGPHGAFVDIYVNDVMQEAIEANEPIDRWPEGSIIVKDGWSAQEGGDYEFLSFMERRSDGWFWAEYNDRGRLVSAGLDDSTCTGCHESGDDSVRAFALPTGQ
jgi:hypothetical protein